MKTRFVLSMLCMLVALFGMGAFFKDDPVQKNSLLDKKVQDFLDRNRGNWHDLNVPEADGQILYATVLAHQYKKGLEIGTSTGLSTIWIAWALSKTGGKLITIEIDKERYLTAVANFTAAGLSGIIDARLADAHTLVAELPGTFDFVFCDADKEWYSKYLMAVLPKLDIGGCFAAHNVTGRQGMAGTTEFYDFAMRQPNLQTTLVPHSSAGISLSIKAGH